MRWLITGSAGRLGVALIARLGADDTGLTGAEDDVIMPLDRAMLDVTDSAAVHDAVSDFRPDVVVNTATGPVETDGRHAYAVDAVGPAVLAAAVAATGGRLVHVSCDAVFSGDATGPYPVEAPTEPRSAYGRAKLAGELAVRELLPSQGYVVRTSWLYSGAGDDLVRRTLATSDPASTTDPVDTEADRSGSPTWVADLAEALITLARSDAPAGVYHCTNSGATSPSGFARAVREERDADPDGSHGDPPPRSADRTEPHQAHVVLSGQEWTAAGLAPLPDWRDALHRAFLVDGETSGTD